MNKNDKIIVVYFSIYVSLEIIFISLIILYGIYKINILILSLLFGTLGFITVLYHKFSIEIFDHLKTNHLYAFRNFFNDKDDVKNFYRDKDDEWLINNVKMRPRPHYELHKLYKYCKKDAYLKKKFVVLDILEYSSLIFVIIMLIFMFTI